MVASDTMYYYQLTFYVPATHAEAVKDALFAKGAGRMGHYACVCWQTSGQGQFRPLEGAKPFVGTQDQIERVAEVKVEMVCEGGLLQTIIAELKKTHPYECPAYAAWRIET